jgi:hypothetical protein
VFVDLGGIFYLLDFHIQYGNGARGMKLKTI